MIFKKIKIERLAHHGIFFSFVGLTPLNSAELQQLEKQDNLMALVFLLILCDLRYSRQDPTGIRKLV